MTSILRRSTPRDNALSQDGCVTFFAMPKPFRDHVGMIQRNAIGSWTRLKPRPQILLFGDEEGVGAVAAAMGAEHLPEIRRNEYGTPLMDDMFRLAHRHARHDTLVYLNADIILTADFPAAIAQLGQAGIERFLMIGRRIDTDIREAIDFSSQNWEDRLAEMVAEHGVMASRVCKDYFVFRRPLFETIPPFAIGRAIYDNWLVSHAREQRIPVIEATKVVRAVHQNHNYAHVRAGRRGRGEAYLKGAESLRNRELAGGMRLIKGSTCEWVLTSRGLRRRRLPSDLLQFACDLPRLYLLALELYGWKRGFQPGSPSQSEPR